MSRKIVFFVKDRRGVTGMMTALVILLFVAILALVIDLGHLHGVRNELQNAADAAALAAARALVKIEDYPVVAAPDPPYCHTAFEKAREAILGNKSDGTPLQMELSSTVDVTLGWWGWDPKDPATFQKFTPYIRQYSEATGANCSLTKINAVNVVVRRSDEGASAGPSVFTTFAKLFGWDSAPVVASSTAAVGYLKENCTFFLFALLYKSDPNSWFQRFLQGSSYMTMHTGTDKSTKMDEGAWADHANNGITPANFIKDYFKALEKGEPFDVPCSGTGTEVDLQGGVDASILHSIKRRLQELRATIGTENDQWNHACNGKNYEGWLMLAPLVTNDSLNKTSPIYDPDQLDPYGHEIGSFVPVLIKNVYNPSDKDAPPDCGSSQGHCIEIAYFPCEVQAQGSPGSTSQMVLATRPKLVQFDWYPPKSSP